MLCLSRRPGEDLLIFNQDTGETIRVKILSDTKGSKVKLGIIASKTYQILRTELLPNPDQDVIYERHIGKLSRDPQ
jgi:sRNA-binding carbon storage regulator CsrA